MTLYGFRSNELDLTVTDFEEMTVRLRLNYKLFLPEFFAILKCFNWRSTRVVKKLILHRDINILVQFVCDTMLLRPTTI